MKTDSLMNYFFSELLVLCFLSNHDTKTGYFYKFLSVKYFLFY